MKILLATQNEHKVLELSALLGSRFSEIVSLNAFPDLQDIVEDGESLQANAIIKARAGFAISGLPTFADDTGLSVAALKGAPGVFAARYAGENASYDQNVEKLLRELSHVPAADRQAVFQTAAVFYNGQEIISALGEVHGSISMQRTGSDGFGYDPVFFVPESNKTYAQMTLEEKNLLSHRKRAFENLITILQQTHQAFKSELQ